LSRTAFHKLFNRKTLKRTIMTENYAASKRTCWSYFIEKIDYDNYTSEERLEIKNLFDRFYNHLHTSTFILKVSPQVIIGLLGSDGSGPVITDFWDTSAVPFGCYKSKTQEADIIVNRKRVTKKYQALTDLFDHKEFKTSIRANYVQSLDACLVRWVLSQQIMYTIHDCFLIDYINISYLVALLNEGMSIQFHDLDEHNKQSFDVFSLFVVL
jgi:hypothetical protein